LNQTAIAGSSGEKIPMKNFICRQHRANTDREIVTLSSAILL
jgi:hypothetical protein